MALNVLNGDIGGPGDWDEWNKQFPDSTEQATAEVAAARGRQLDRVIGAVGRWVAADGLVSDWRTVEALWLTGREHAALALGGMHLLAPGSPN